VHASPVETERKCVVLLEADRLNPESSNTLLKSIEEPPPRTIIILVAESAAELAAPHGSGRSCQQVDFARVRCLPMSCSAELERRGVPEARARLGAALPRAGPAGSSAACAVRPASPLPNCATRLVDVPARRGGLGDENDDRAPAVAPRCS